MVIPEYRVQSSNDKTFYSTADSFRGVSFFRKEGVPRNGGGNCDKTEVIWCGCIYGFNGNFVSQNCSAQLPRPLRVHPFFHKEGDVKLAKQKNARMGVYYCPNNALRKFGLLFI